VLVGKLHSANKGKYLEHVGQLGLDVDQVIFTGWIPDRLLIALYQSAELFAFASLYEGFGLPAAEAIACGCPTITSNTSTLPEILEWEPSTFDPHSAEEISARIETALTSQQFLADLRTRGTERASEFTWDMVAAKTFDALGVLPSPGTHQATSLRLAFVTSGGSNTLSASQIRLLKELATISELELFGRSNRRGREHQLDAPQFALSQLGRISNPAAYDAILYSGNGIDDLKANFPGIPWLEVPADGDSEIAEQLIASIESLDQPTEVRFQGISSREMWSE
jgi:hypothetical protein